LRVPKRTEMRRGKLESETLHKLYIHASDAQTWQDALIERAAACASLPFFTMSKSRISPPVTPVRRDSPEKPRGPGTFAPRPQNPGCKDGPGACQTLFTCMKAP
jgi:hypothetical protein